MEENRMKNIIVLKNLPSNIVEEAIVILKPNKEVKLEDYAKKTHNVQANSSRTTAKDYLVKEAEMVISNYLSNIESNKKIKNNAVRELEKKYKRLKKLTYILSGTLLLGVLVGVL